MNRPALTRDSIAAAAMRVIETGGLESLTLRSLAHELGVDRTAMYRHFRTKDELLESVLDQLVAELIGPTTVAGSDGDWTDTAIALAQRLRSLLRSHPGLARLIASGPISARVAQIIDDELDLLHRAGFAADEARLLLRTILSFTVGFALLEASSAERPTAPAGSPRTTGSPAERFWWPDQAELDRQFALGLRATFNARLSPAPTPTS